MLRVVLEMLDFLLAIEHLPAFDAENFTIRFLLNCVQLLDEGVPLFRVSFYHFERLCFGWNEVIDNLSSEI